LGIVKLSRTSFSFLALMGLGRAIGKTVLSAVFFAGTGTGAGAIADTVIFLTTVLAVVLVAVLAEGVVFVLGVFVILNF
jgi:hypothetical protein